MEGCCRDWDFLTALRLAVRVGPVPVVRFPLPSSMSKMLAPMASIPVSASITLLLPSLEALDNAGAPAEMLTSGEEKGELRLLRMWRLVLLSCLYDSEGSSFVKDLLSCWSRTGRTDGSAGRCDCSGSTTRCWSSSSWKGIWSKGKRLCSMSAKNIFISSRSLGIKRLEGLPKAKKSVSSRCMMSERLVR